ncbi:hypothetical protein MKX03_008358, partial [Papaver bracteatum]
EMVQSSQVAVVLVITTGWKNPSRPRHSIGSHHGFIICIPFMEHTCLSYNIQMGMISHSTTTIG